MVSSSLYWTTDSARHIIIHRAIRNTRGVPVLPSILMNQRRGAPCARRVTEAHCQGLPSGKYCSETECVRSFIVFFVESHRIKASIRKMVARKSTSLELVSQEQPSASDPPVGCSCQVSGASLTVRFAFCGHERHDEKIGSHYKEKVLRKNVRKLPMGGHSHPPWILSTTTCCSHDLSLAQTETKAKTVLPSGSVFCCRPYKNMRGNRH